MQSIGLLRESRARKCHTFILFPEQKLHHVVLLILVWNTAYWRLREIGSRWRKQLQARSGFLFSWRRRLLFFLHTFGVRIYLSLTQCGRERLIRLALKSNWKLVWRMQELRGWQFDRWGMQSRLSHRTIWEGSFETWSRELSFAGRLWKFFSWRKKGR